MKKSVIGLILLAVFVIIVSPGIIGKLAEDSVSDNLDWAAAESGEVIITSAGFDRGWFSSEGVHRVEIGDGELRSALSSSADPLSDEELPVLLINTRIDHGIIPLSSMSRDKGSLAPGLGRAISTLSIESPDGETMKIPGTIYSELGLGGGLVSQYVLEAGSHTVGDSDFSWDAGEALLTVSAKSGDFDYRGDFGKLSANGPAGPWSLDSLTFDGSLASTPHGIYVGKLDLELGSITITEFGQSTVALKSASLKGSSAIDEGRLSGAFRLDVDARTAAIMGDASIVADMSFKGFDAAAWGAITRELDQLSASQDARSIMTMAETELMDLMAAGLEIKLNQLDIGSPMGMISSTMSIQVPESDRAGFTWSSLLLAVAGELYLSVPEALVNLATTMDPQVGAIVGMGFLAKDGSAYTMDARFEKGLLTINGAPMPIPLGAFQ